ncbi:MAG: hypothetical protein J6M92_06020 [Oribacterium sp.]|nr:hypothetical protein [Oribacterium sp.]
MKDLIIRLRRMLRRTSLGMDDDVIRTICIVVVSACIYIAIGLAIKGGIDTWQMERNAKFNKALRIESDEAYKYAADTSAGNAYGYGQMEALNPVTVAEIGGAYISLSRVKEHYTCHTRTYTTTDGKGHTQVHTEVYWTWDAVEDEFWHSDAVRFKGIEIRFDDISGIGQNYIDTIRIDTDDRYVFRGAGKTLEGTVFGNMTGGTVKDAVFHEGADIESAAKADVSTDFGIVFIIIWIVIPIVALIAVMAG